MGWSADIRLLAAATLRLYANAAKGAAAACLINWRMPLIHVLCLAVIGIFAPFLLLFGPVAGGFLLGMVLAVVLGGYIFTVTAAVSGERLDFRDPFSRRALDFFGPTLSVLFAFFLLSIAANLLFARPGNEWLTAVVNLLIAVFFNPLPEIIGQRPGPAMEMLRESIEFMFENFVEWILPWFLLLVPIVVISPASAFQIMLGAATTHPLRMLESFALFFGGGPVLVHAVPVFLSVVCFFFVFCFRAELFRALHGKSRRTRIYQERFRG